MSDINYWVVDDSTPLYDQMFADMFSSSEYDIKEIPLIDASGGYISYRGSILAAD